MVKKLNRDEIFDMGFEQVTAMLNSEHFYKSKELSDLREEIFDLHFKLDVEAKDFLQKGKLKARLAKVIDDYNQLVDEGYE
jgi:hypothetical protein